MTDTTPTRYGHIDGEDLKKRVKGYGAYIQETIRQNVPMVNDVERFFPFTPDGEDQAIEFWTREGNAGIMGVERSAQVPPTKAILRRHLAQTTIDKFAYMWTYEAMEQQKNPNELMQMDAADAIDFFAAVRQYKQIYALGNGAGKEVAAEGYWNETDPSDKIYECLDHLNDYGWKDGMLGNVLLFYPSRVGVGLKSTRFVNGSYTSVAEDIQRTYGNRITFIPYAPYRSANNAREIDLMMSTDSDVLGTNALLVVGNAVRVLKSKEYRFQNTPNVFTYEVEDYGIMTVLHRQCGCMVIPAFNADDTDDTDDLNSATTTPYICKITGVAAARS